MKDRKSPSLAVLLALCCIMLPACAANQQTDDTPAPTRVIATAPHDASPQPTTPHRPTPTPAATADATRAPIVATVPRPTQTPRPPPSTPVVLPPSGDFFPFGFYLWGSMTRDMEVIASAGFNTVHLTSTLVDRSEFLSVLDEAQSLGLRVLIEIDQDNVTGDVLAYRRKPAVLGYVVHDDCIPGTRPDIAEKTALIHRLDPAHAAYAACGDYGGNASADAAAADLAGVEIYSLTTRDGAHLTGPTTARYVDAAAAQGHQVVCVCQSYPNGGRDPTPAQVRFQTWAALAAGARGAVYYSFEDNGGLPVAANLDERNPALWDEFTALAPEVLGQPWLSGGTYTRLVNTDRLTVGEWSYGDARFIVAAASQIESQRVNVAIGEGTATKLFARYADLSVSNGHLKGVLPPYGVAVYRIA